MKIVEVVRRRLEALQVVPHGFQRKGARLRAGRARVDRVRRVSKQHGKAVFRGKVVQLPGVLGVERLCAATAGVPREELKCVGADRERGFAHGVVALCGGEMTSDMQHSLILSVPVFENFLCGADHFLCECGNVFPVVERFRAVVRHHAEQLLLGQLAVSVFENDAALREARGLRPFALLCGRIAEHKHADRRGLRRQAEQRPVRLEVFDDVADVARADAEALRGRTGGVRGDHRVVCREDQVAQLRGRHVARFAAGELEFPVPAVVIRAENQHHFGRGDERLVVAGDGQLVLDRLVGDVEYRIQHHVARGRRAHRGVEDGFPDFGRDLPVLKNAHGFARVEQADGFIHGRRSPLLQFSFSLPQRP